MSANGHPVIRLDGVTKVFFTDEVETHALSGNSPRYPQGEYVSIAGPSGCGKSTLLSILGLLDTPTGGNYILNGKPAQNLNSRRARAHSQPRDRLHLPELQPDRRSHGVRERRTAAHLSRHASRRNARSACRKRSSASAWRIACGTIRHSSPAVSSSAWPWPARLAGSPSILLADEPTGNLDSVNGEAVMDLLRELHRNGATICMVTHDPRFAARADGVHLFDGRVVDDQDVDRAHDERELVESGFRINDGDRQRGKVWIEKRPLGEPMAHTCDRTARRHRGSGRARDERPAERDPAGAPFLQAGAPPFTATALATIAIAIGSNAAIFSIVDAVVLSPLPYRSPTELVAVWEMLEGGQGEGARVAARSFVAWRERADRKVIAGGSRRSADRA